jgi:Zn finger protein HypA/HybF involved in hydrogenase expression
LGAFYPRIFARKTSEVEEIPSEILCPGCGTGLELDEKEIKEKMFTCPECKETFHVTD